ncbi:MAG TPA: GNAT family protein [Dokdonella sp.]|uniref:GNAT family N-acetyltransferase n=1 Tax=Dokdonella sp. TaxID=2291710 RepID=UPI002D7F4B7B|nr:GNAT family protein [Dokdonella sp.]HET9033617.1 GNAT family protein [Dokdonella sp.]
MKSKKTLPTLDSRRLRLRQLQLSDIEDLFAIFSDEQTMRYWSHAPFKQAAEAEAYLRNINAGRINGTHLQWGVALRENDKVIGTTTLFSLNPKHRRAEIGYALSSAYWRNGFGREALTTVIAYALDSLDFQRIEADIDPRNVASCRLVESLGFQLEGRLRERWHVEGEIQDSAIYGLLAREFSAER